ncbi:hypothetical protein [Ideonella livida]|uniref:Uncharacterized protein n=1 Tax=Ideonella livida TaxID=2707176 RepID=A0A7C9PEG0_9BURK|nr:hypothetical protein [Ideonella livida]NDY89817.1 hypothetical protein [Ideonella livida]
MSADLPPLPHEHLARPIQDIDSEIVRLASVCGLHLHDPYVITRLLHGDSGVCTQHNPRAFDKLRQLLEMHYVVTSRAVLNLGADEATAMAQAIAAQLRRRFGPERGADVAQALYEEVDEPPPPATADRPGDGDAAVEPPAR